MKNSLKMLGPLMINPSHPEYVPKICPTKWMRWIDRLEAHPRYLTNLDPLLQWQQTKIPLPHLTAIALFLQNFILAHQRYLAQDQPSWTTLTTTNSPRSGRCIPTIPLHQRTNGRWRLSSCVLA